LKIKSDRHRHPTVLGPEYFSLRVIFCDHSIVSFFRLFDQACDNSFAAYYAHLSHVNNQVRTKLINKRRGSQFHFTELNSQLAFVQKSPPPFFKFFQRGQ
jgi:hypothetical protein